MSEQYVTLQGSLKARTEKAVLFEVDGAKGWVARSCLHFSSDKAVDAADIGDELELRMMEWVAKDRGLV